jgi:hypothetical protein
MSVQSVKSPREASHRLEKNRAMKWQTREIMIRQIIFYIMDMSKIQYFPKLAVRNCQFLLKMAVFRATLKIVLF